MGALPEHAELIGLDGGATSARACRVVPAPQGLEVLRAGPSQLYAPVPGFVPVLEAARDTPLSMREHHQARAWTRAAADAVASVWSGAALLLGVAMPGRKTGDGRGLAWLRHGPRAPQFLGALERELEQRGVTWLAPAAGLFSDGHCAALGERLASGGALAGVREALYLGGGTGLAEAALTGGRVVGLDEAPLALAPARALAAEDGLGFEEHLSMSGLVARCGGFPEGQADAPRVRAVLAGAMRALAELGARRAGEWRAAGRGELERVVVGQRLGHLLLDPRCAFLGDLLAGELAARGLPATGWLSASRTPHTGALGAAARALESWRGEHD